MHEDIFFQLLDLCFDPVADREIVVHDKVNEQIQEPVRLADLLLPKYRLDRAELVDFWLVTVMI